jgi:serine O-acetyltransferase
MGRKPDFIEKIFPLYNNKYAVGLYRIAHFFAVMRLPLLPYFVYLINAILFGCEIHYRSKIGKNFRLVHSAGVIVGRDVIIGDNVKVYSGVVIGKSKPKSGMPNICDNVVIGSGAKVMGDIVIGDSVFIGANAVVSKSILKGKVQSCSHYG